MRKNTLIKLFVFIGFAFMALFAFIIPTWADEVEPTQTTTTTTESQEEAEEPSTTTIDINPAISVEVENPEETGEATEEDSAFVKWIKSLDTDTVKGWIITLMAKLGIDTAVLFAMLIYFVKSKVKDAKTSKFYNDLISKMDAEHQKELEKVTNEFVTRLEELQAQVTNEIKKANSDERKQAKDNVDKMKAALNEITVELDK